MDDPTPIQELQKNLQALQGGVNRTVSRQEDAVALGMLPRFRKEHYLPWTESAMRPSSILVILNEVIIHNRKVIVECGSGVSTLYLARVIEGTGTQLISIDHDAKWQGIVRSQAESLGVSLENVRFVEAPMSKCALSPEGLEWYDTDAITAAIAGLKIDTLVVDGPLACHPSIANARYPALPFFRDYMADDFAVFLDDTNRAGEQAIARRWAKDYSLDGRFLPERGGVCLLHPAKARRFNVV